MTHDYKRHGMTTLFAALNVTVIGRFAEMRVTPPPNSVAGQVPQRFTAKI